MVDIVGHATPVPISIVIPTLNEGRQLGAVLAALPTAVEVIVADGGSGDDTLAVATAHGAKVVASPPGRGTQLNAGAAQAKGEVLLFLHADTALPENWPVLLAAALADPAVVGGGFALEIDSHDYFLKMVARTATWRSRRYCMFYGDQAIFVRRRDFVALTGFPEQPIMEDVGFIRALRRRGNLALIDVPVRTSARRWERENPLYTMLRNWVLVMLYSAGVAPATLVRWYRPERE